MNNAAFEGEAFVSGDGGGGGVSVDAVVVGVETGGARLASTKTSMLEAEAVS